jgi:mannose-6-phosphate isomerase-like protein (cupin superfamily)
MTVETTEEVEVGQEFDRIQTFTMLGTPLLEKGRFAELIALAPQLWVHAKVYAGGGERGLHSHPNEDHLFFVLAGSATFRTIDDEKIDVGPYQGILIPRGVVYAFDTTSEESLVIVRIGAGEENKAKNGRIAAKKSRGVDGTPAYEPGEGVQAAGRTFTGA